MLGSTDFFKHNFQSDNELKNIVSSENLAYYKGSGLRSAYTGAVCFTKNLNLIVFKKLPDCFDIDFIAQKLQVGAIYVVPPDHKFHISPNSSCQYYCFEISISVLDKQFRQLLNAISYEKEKSLVSKDSSEFLDWVINIKNDTPLIDIIDRLKHLITTSNTKKTIPFIPQDQYLLSCQFLSLLTKPEFFINQNIKNYAEILGCCTKTLQRACLKNFKVKPQQMIKHHLFMSSLKLLKANENTIEEIALKLGYSDSSSFSKFIKTHIDLTPKEIRRRLYFAEF